MKILNSMFFKNLRGECICLVLIENPTGEKKGYIGLCEGEDQKVDELDIANHGAPVMKGILEGAFPENFENGTKEA